MADKRITDLPLILSGDVSSLDVLPIVNVELDITNKITANQLKAYINSGLTDVFVTGGTYSAGTATFTNNTGGTFNVSGFFTNDTNFANTDLTFTGNRTHNLDGNYLFLATDLTFSNLSSFLYLDNNELQIGNYSSSEGMFLDFSGNTTFIRSYLNHNIINFNTGVGFINSNVTINDENTNQINFIVKGFNDNSLIFSDPLNDRIGIGTDTPTEKLTVSGNTNITGTLNIGTIGGGLPIINLGLDSSGYVVTGGTSTGDYLPLSGGTVTGDTIFTQGLSATTISATTYQNLPLGIYGTGLTFNIGDYNLDLDGPNGILDTINLGSIASDMNVTGGTYNSGTGVATFTNNTGGTFNVSGFLVGYTDHYVTGFTYDNINTFNIYDNSGSTFSASITTLSATTISGGTLYGDGSNLTGISTQDTRVTGFTYDDLNNLTIFDSTGGTFSVNVDIMSALTVTNGLSGGTISITNSPVVSVSPTYILSRNSSTGEIEFTAYSAVTRTIDPFNNIGSASTIAWNVSGVSANYEVTLTANTTLNISNVRSGDYGTIILKQDGVGSRTLTFGTINGASGTNRHKVSNGGGGNVFLTSNANAVDLLTFAYNGTNLYWTIGNDYT